MPFPLSRIPRRALALATVSLSILAVACSTMDGAAPPAPPSDGDDTEIGEVVVTGSRVSRDDSRDRTDGDTRISAPSEAPVMAMAPPPPPPPPTMSESSPPRPRPQPRPQAQAGLLTAGDYDDLLNPTWYADYAGRFLQTPQGRDMPWVDTRGAITIAVSDADGRPAPFVEVTVSRPRMDPLRLRTLADGTVVLFPIMDQLGRTADVTVDTGQRRTTRQLTVGPDRRLDIRTEDRVAQVRAFDLLLVVDATGSMGDEMEYLKRELASIMGSLAERHPGVDTRIGLIVYRDNGDQYVVRDFPFTGDVDALVRQLSDQRAEGGGDYPEAMDAALERAMAYPWRDNAVRSLVLVADAPPHGDRIGATWEQVQEARRRRIQITPVAASGVADEAEFVMRAAAAATQSRYLFLTDDSGVGNPHATPEVKCYLVTRLDSLLRRVLDGQISGRRIEPTDNEVIRRVGPYDDGVCTPKPL